MLSKALLRTLFLSLVGLAPLTLSAQPDLARTDDRVDYRTQIRPLLARYCYECHGRDHAKREADLRLDAQRYAFRDLGGYRTIVPGKPQQSELYLRVASEYAETRMPPYEAGTQLDEEAIDLIRRWIEEGAEWIDDDRDRVRSSQRSGRRAGKLPDQPFLIHTHDIADVRVSVLARGLSHPWSLAFLPGGDLLVTERSGSLRRVHDGVLVPEPVAGLPTDVVTQGSAGLMEVALHPRFDDNRWVYLSYTRQLDETTGTVALIRGRLDGLALRDVEDVFVAEPWRTSETGDTERPQRRLHRTAAARLAFAPDGTLFMTMGWTFGDPRPNGTTSPSDYPVLAQDLSSHAGKILRLNDDGTVPRDNPFVGREGAKPEIYSMGHRNPQGLAIHPQTGVLYATEHGMQGGDELNVIEAGANYGWPLISYGRLYEGPRISERFWKEGMKEPAVFWVPSIGPSGLAIYTGDRFPDWKGNLFAGSLREGSISYTGHLERIVFNRRGEEVRRESLLTELRQRIRDVRQGPDGLLYLLTEENEAAVLRLEPVDSGVE